MKKQRKYDREFKLNAVKLYRKSGKGLAKIASHLLKSSTFGEGID